jgi:uncharacterized membrane protein
LGLYLVFDNAGNHQIVDAFDEFTKAITVFNIKFIWQVSLFPVTNMLDH